MTHEAGRGEALSEWQPIETAADWLRAQGISMLLEKNAPVHTWGNVLLYSPKDNDASGAHIFVGKLIDWGAQSKDTHWRDSNAHDGETIKPTHWMPLPEPPKEGRG